MTVPSLHRRHILRGLGGLVLTTAPLRLAAAEPTASALNFLAIGDWGREGDCRQRAVAAQMATTAAHLNAAFVISVGDNFYEDGVTSVHDPAWQKSFESIYDASSLQIPWYVTLGNHDYHGNSQAQLEYSSRSSRWRLPSRWYSFEERAPDGAAVAFFVIDTSPMISEYYYDGAVRVKVGGQRQYVKAQLAWLDSALSTSQADWKIVIGHHPIYSGWTRSILDWFRWRDGPRGTGDLIAKVDPLLQRYRVHLYLNGHDHDLQHIAWGTTHYVCTGAGSRMGPYCFDVTGSDFCSLQPGFVVGRVNRDRLQVAYRDHTGAQLHVVEIPRTV